MILAGLADVSGKFHSSTPLQCRHDSGFESYPKDYRSSQELSPIRKQPSLTSEIVLPPQSFLCSWNKKRCNILKDMVAIKLNFSNLSEVNGVNLLTDSGTECITSVSTSECKSLLDKEAQLPKDENGNFTCMIDYNAKNKLLQPLKYICRDHTHEKSSRANKYYMLIDSSDIFRSYAVTSQLINSEKKNSKLDFLHELYFRNCTGIISHILSYLPDECIRQASNVSKEWRYIVHGDRNANNRRKCYLSNKRNAVHGPDKENRLKSASPDKRDHKSAFTCVVNVKNETKQPLLFDNLGKFDSFIQELKTGGQQALVKCPKCCYSARAEIGYKYCCTRNLCKHEFCKRCLGPYLDNHACTVPELNNSLPNIIICSKKSRKNLRRLKA